MTTKGGPRHLRHCIHCHSDSGLNDQPGHVGFSRRSLFPPWQRSSSG